MIVENIKEAQRVKTIFLIIPTLFVLLFVIVMLLELKEKLLIIGISAAVMCVILIALSLMQYRYFIVKSLKSYYSLNFTELVRLTKSLKHTK